jgi:hypothetical protein
VDTAALITEVNALKEAAASLTWSSLKEVLRVKIAQAILNGGTTSYTINGRSKTVSVDWLRQMLDTVDAQAAIDSAPGGIVASYGGFARVGCEY